MTIAMPPPPEKPEAVRARSNVIFSFWGLILLLGLPTWWYTTAIPRAALPIQEMLAWEGNQPSYPINIRIAAPDLRCEPLQKVAIEAERLLSERNEFPVVKLHVQPVRFKTTENKYAWSDKDAVNCPEIDLDAGTHMSGLDLEMREGSGFFMDLTGKTSPATATYSGEGSDGLASFLADALAAVFEEEKAAVAYRLASSQDTESGLQQYMQGLSPEITSEVSHDVARALKPSTNYHLTFSLITAGGTPSSWDIQPVLNHYIHPFVHALLSTANISVTTQVQMYSAMSPSIEPYSIEGFEGKFLRESDLTAFVNAAEWPLSPSIGSGPTINFILYIPTKDQLPLQIEGSKTTSWLIPQWGGISILNPPLVMNPDTHAETIVAHLDSEVLQSCFETFQAQLLSLLGIPLPRKLPLSLRLRAFQRLSGLALYLRTTSNLGSLARLVQRLNNIPVPHHVSELVGLAKSGLVTYREQGLLSSVQNAYEASEKAFFDKSMIGQVYFPDEHKVAVYLPLLGPIGVPLVVGLLRELKQRISSR